MVMVVALVPVLLIRVVVMMIVMFVVATLVFVMMIIVSHESSNTKIGSFKKCKKLSIRCNSVAYVRLKLDLNITEITINPNANVDKKLIVQPVSEYILFISQVV